MGDTIKREFQPGQVITGTKPQAPTESDMMGIPMQLPNPSAPISRPTFVSAFLQNLGPALQGGAGAPTFSAGVGGGLQGIEEHNRYKQQQQMLQQAQQYKIADDSSQAALRKAQADALGEQVTLPNGVSMPLSLAKVVYPQYVAAGSREKVAGTVADTSVKTTEMGDKSREQIAANALEASKNRLQGQKEEHDKAAAALAEYRRQSLALSKDRLELSKFGPSGQSKSRADAALAQNSMIDNAMELLQDPETLAMLGPLPGRVSEMEKSIGDQSPKVQKLYGTLKSIYALAGTTHGWRALQVAEEFEKAFGGLHTNPQALIAGLQALHDSGDAIQQSVGREPGQVFNKNNGSGATNAPINITLPSGKKITIQ